MGQRLENQKASLRLKMKEVQREISYVAKHIPEKGPVPVEELQKLIVVAQHLTREVYLLAGFQIGISKDD